MRGLGSWWRGVVIAGRASPLQAVEALMLLLAGLLCLIWCFDPKWPYLTLCLSYILGAIASILAREVVMPSSETHKIRVTALLCLVILVSAAGVYLLRAWD